MRDGKIIVFSWIWILYDRDTVNGERLPLQSDILRKIREKNWFRDNNQSRDTQEFLDFLRGKFVVRTRNASSIRNGGYFSTKTKKVIKKRTLLRILIAKLFDKYEHNVNTPLYKKFADDVIISNDSTNWDIILDNICIMTRIYDRLGSNPVHHLNNPNEPS